MRRYLIALLSTLATLTAPASATIIGGSVTGGEVFGLGGTFIKLSVPLSNGHGPPNSVGEDNFQMLHLFGFDEDQNILLGAPLDIDVGVSPVPAGATVASHYIFFDPGLSRSVIGSVDFDSDVYGIISSTGFLAASDFLANTGVNYLNPSARGLEAGDTAWISGPRQISVDFTAASPGDYIRVLTQFSPAASLVPEPSTWMMLLIGFGMIGAMARRKRPEVALA